MTSQTKHSRREVLKVLGLGDAKWKLHDLKADPGETKDMAAGHPDVVKAMPAAYDTWRDEVLPCLENEDAVGPAVNPFKELYWKQFGGGPAGSDASPRQGRKNKKQ